MDCIPNKNKKKPDDCKKLPGTILRIKIPAGTVIDILDLLEVTITTKICLILRIPKFKDEEKKSFKDKEKEKNPFKDKEKNPFEFDTLVDAIKDSDVTVEFEQL
ncbi:hypothetical protein GOQ29_04640 [Clostridium sp. D2Q-14]|uniref:hypothetical protein n=1 Tax=Anaeromonas gelatinilytica TaxID=2683194 RepID=UPI00193BD5B5|nr:hypothetical protein [Anaeromonas gelatinilytica]MBS4534902.1 hypothetical protein [Anaeromonas gelatinilytica]